MLHQKILNSKEVKRLLSELGEHFGDFGLEGYAVLKNQDDKFFLISRKFGVLDTRKVRINNLGLYFCKHEVDGMRLSIEGAQLVSPSRNVVDIGKQQAFSWMRGEDVEVGDVDASGYVVLRFGKDILGCGKLKSGRVLNSVQKSRRVVGNISGDEEGIRTVR